MKNIKFERMRHWKGGISLLLILLTRCIPEPLDVDVIPVVQPQIVVSTQIVPDQSLLVLLTRTFGALDASEDSDPEELLDQIAVNDAVVTITGPDGTHTLRSLGHGGYGGLFIPFVEGETYTLDINSASLGKVNSTTTVKSKVSFASIEASLHVNDFEDTLAEVKHNFKDKVGKNFYMITTQQVKRSELAEQLLNPNAYIRLLKDTNFDGVGYGETFRVVRREFSPGDSILVSLSNISEEYYRFMELRQDNRFNFIEYLSEPINYPSNISGGKGFFNLYVPDIRLLVLEPPGN